MSLDHNLSGLVGHAKDFSDRIEFTYSILDGDEVIGCVYIHPTTTAGYGAEVRSWVTEDRRDMDVLVWQSLSEWIGERWPFQAVLYAPRDEV